MAVVTNKVALACLFLKKKTPEKMMRAQNNLEKIN
jgi:hypothetical protein